MKNICVESDKLSRRFKDAQVNRTLIHPKLPQPTEKDDELLYCLPCEQQSDKIKDEDDDDDDQKDTNTKTEEEVTAQSHSFVICADSQLGMTSLNLEWETELNNCRKAVTKINTLQPRPKFVCMCGDIVDMEQSFYYNNPKALRKFDTLEECDAIQNKQNEDFQNVFNNLHEDIAIVCLCGNHDVGNRPTPNSIHKFRNAFGDEYLAFWVNGSYNIVLNNVLFFDPTAAMDMHKEQIVWLEQRLEYAVQHKAVQIFVFTHHPWFLYDENEDEEDLGNHGSPFPKEWYKLGKPGQFDKMIFPDSYFPISKKYRMGIMDLFQKYNVSACFSGHFHQNLVSQASFGMSMIITAPLSMVFESSGKPVQREENGMGIRIVNVFPHSKDNQEEERQLGCGRFTHHFERI
jgi:hypothetical protein